MDGEVAELEVPVDSGADEGFEESTGEDTSREIAPSEAPEPKKAPGEEIPQGEPQSKEVAQALKELRQTNPRIADALRKAYFGYGQLTQHFPSAREAQAA